MEIDLSSNNHFIYNPVFRYSPITTLLHLNCMRDS